MRVRRSGGEGGSEGGERRERETVIKERDRKETARQTERERVAERGREWRKGEEGRQKKREEKSDSVLTCFSSFCCLRLRLSSSRALQRDMIKDQSVVHHTKSALWCCAAALTIPSNVH